MNIAVYKPKKLIQGAMVDNQYKGKLLVAVPLNKLMLNCAVCYQNKTMIIPLGKEYLTQLKFTDKYGRGEYFLCYYEWKPEQIQFTEWIGGAM